MANFRTVYHGLGKISNLGQRMWNLALPLWKVLVKVLVALMPTCQFSTSVLTRNQTPDITSRNSNDIHYTKDSDFVNTLNKKFSFVH